MLKVTPKHGTFEHKSKVKLSGDDLKEQLHKKGKRQPKPGKLQMCALEGITGFSYTLLMRRSNVPVPQRISMIHLRR